MSTISTCMKTAALAAALSFSATAAFAQSSAVTSEQALAAMKAALEYAKKDGGDVSVVVVDREGKPVLMMRGNTAAPHNLGLAQRKAYTANMFKMTSLAWRDRTMQGKLVRWAPPTNRASVGWAPPTIRGGGQSPPYRARRGRFRWLLRRTQSRVCGRSS